MTTDINRAAPATAEASGRIAAPPQVVWDVLTDFPNWSLWNSEVSTMDFVGPLAPGSTFTWKAGAATIRSQLLEVVPGQRIVWAGRTFPGIKAIHSWSLRADGDHTVVQTEESFDGFVVRLMRGKMQKMLRETLENSIRMLAAEAERVITAGPAS